MKQTSLLPVCSFNRQGIYIWRFSFLFCWRSCPENRPSYINPSQAASLLIYRLHQRYIWPDRWQSLISVSHRYCAIVYMLLLCCASVAHKAHVLTRVLLPCRFRQLCAAADLELALIHGTAGAHFELREVQTLLAALQESPAERHGASQKCEYQFTVAPFMSWCSLLILKYTCINCVAGRFVFWHHLWYRGGAE